MAGILGVLPSQSQCLLPRCAPGETSCEAGEVRSWEKSQNMYSEKGVSLETAGLPEPKGTSKM